MVSSLSKEFASGGCDVRVFTPLYSSLKRTPDFKKEMDNLSVHMGLGIEEFASVWTAPLGKAKVSFLEFNRYYDRPGIYNFGAVSYEDNGGRFAFLARAALDYCLATGDSRHCPCTMTTGLFRIFEYDLALRSAERQPFLPNTICSIRESSTRGCLNMRAFR